MCMAMTSINFKRWEDNPLVKKGNRGEELVRKWGEARGAVFYKAITDKAHPFDFMVTKDRKTVSIVEVKTKAKMRYYNATGFNVRHYEEYKRIAEKHNCKVFIAFVDEDCGKIYGGYLDEIEKPRRCADNDGRLREFPMRFGKGRNETIVFPVDIMTHIADLSPDDIAFMRKHSARNYQYDN